MIFNRKFFNVGDWDRAFKVMFALFVMAFVMVDPALANNGNRTLGQVTQDVRDQTLKPILDVGVFLAYMIGIGIVGVGINKFMKVSRGDQQTTPGEAAAYLFGGGALMALGYFADSASTTIAGNAGAWSQRSSVDMLQALLPHVASVHALLPHIA